MKRSVTFIVYPRFELLDLSGPVSAFNLANERHGAPYSLVVASEHGGPVVDRAGISIETTPLSEVEGEDTVVAVGGPTAHLNLSGTPLIDQLCRAGTQARRVASVCTGAFLLGAAGFLDERHATTHWRYADLLTTLYPKIRVDADKIYVRDDNVWTSAGMSAGIDLALALIEDDFDPRLAKDVATDLVVYYQRPGGQSQFSSMLKMDPEIGRIKDALTYAQEHLREPLSVERLAEVACLSPRQFSRVFSNKTGQSPGRAIERLRLEIALPKIKDKEVPLEVIARDVGFGDLEKMRRSCKNILGQTPQELRRLARDRVR